MQSSQKLKIFYYFFIAFLEKTSNFSHTEKKYGIHSSSNSENIDSEKRGYLNVFKAPFNNTLEN